MGSILSPLSNPARVLFPIIPASNDPQNLVGTVISDTRIDVTWDLNGNTSVSLEWTIDDGDYSTGWTISSLPFGIENYSLFGLTPNTQYAIRVQGDVSGGYSHIIHPSTLSMLLNDQFDPR